MPLPILIVTVVALFFLASFLQATFRKVALGVAFALLSVPAAFFLAMGLGLGHATFISAADGTPGGGFYGTVAVYLAMNVGCQLFLKSIR